MTPDRRPSLETKRAMFRAALAAQLADEPYVSGDRLAGSLLRTDAVREFCSRAGIDSVRALDAVDDTNSPSFEECERRAKEPPAVQLRPLDPVLKPAFDAVMERHGQLAISPLMLLLEIILAHPPLAMRLAPHGLTPEAIRIHIGKENE